MNNNTSQPFFEGFAWAVPTAFTDCLNECRFQVGDRLYDSPQAYQRWEEALKTIRFSVQVQSTGQNTAAGESHGSKSRSNPERRDNSFEQGWSSEVVCEFTDFKRKRTEEIRSTQGRLYTLLWRGEVDILRSPNQPRVPLICGALTRALGNASEDMPIEDESESDAQSLRKSLRAAAAEIRSRLHTEAENADLFLTVYDPTNPVSVSKCDEVRLILARKFRAVEKRFRLGEVGLGNLQIVPTIELIAFMIPGVRADVEDALKTALYKPVAGSGSGKDRFKLERHGYYLPSEVAHPLTPKVQPLKQAESAQQALI